MTRGLEWEEMVAQNSPLEAVNYPKLEDTWSILFTSGTTGSPKGVIHDYENAAMLVRNEEVFDQLKGFSAKDPAFFSFLPLNHIAERVAIEINAMAIGATISFAESLDTFAKNLQDTQPTLFFAVPRIWTKFQLGILQKMPQKKLDRLLSIPILSSMVKKKVRQALGLSRAKVVLTGASITPESTKQFFRQLGINLREVYGMTENAGGFTLMPEDYHKPNTVGKPSPNSEGKVDPVTGEILMKMPWMMIGYYKDPEMTAKVLKDGWLHTGDRGTIDEDGFFSVIGRVRDAFKTAKGKFVVPTVLEDKFTHSDFIEQICVAGLGLPQPIALVNLSEIGSSVGRDKLDLNLQELLEEANKSLRGHEVISTLVITREAWSPDNNLLTPTLKVRRTAINESYQNQFSQWHEDDRQVIWEEDTF